MEYTSKILTILLYVLIRNHIIIANVLPNEINNELCLKPCPKIIDPVCGTDGNILKLFNSPCTMSQYSCENREEWNRIELKHCIETEIPEGRNLCERPCPFIYLPICGHNGKESKIFPNQCVMEVENCSLQDKYIEAKFTDCHIVVPL